MNNRRGLFLGLLVFAMVTWGLSWASGKFISVKAASPVLLFWRFLFTFVSLVPLVYVIEKNLKIQKDALFYVVSGGIIMSLYNYLFFQGLHNGLAGAGGVLVTTMNPVFTFLITSVILKYQPGKREIIGLILGFGGGLVMIKVWRISVNELAKSGNMFFLGASLVWAYMTIISQYSGKKVSALKFSLYVHGVAAVISFSAALNNGLSDVFRLSSSFWLNILYLSIVSTTFGTTIYFAASQKLGAKTASSFIFVVPLSAMLSGIFFLNESADIVLLSGGVMSLGAVYLINSGGRKKNIPDRNSAIVPKN